jgi:hypothetical protein
LCFLGNLNKRLKELSDLFGIARVGSTLNKQLQGLGQVKTYSLTGPLRPLSRRPNLIRIGACRWGTSPLSAHSSYHGRIIPTLISR